jgi:predicted Zn-dependent peptidase
MRLAILALASSAVFAQTPPGGQNPPDLPPGSAAPQTSAPPASQAPSPGAPAAGRPAGAPARTPPVPAVKELKFPPLHPIEVPKVEIVTLADGMKVFLLEDRELPVINGSARIRTGNLFDPADKVGLATMTGMVLRTGGTKAKTGDQLDSELEDIAARVESNIGETSGSVSFSALKENTDQVLGIFHDVLTSPEFRQDKIDLARSQMDSSISRRNDSAGGIAQREFADIVYGKDTPYGWDEQYATVDRIARDDVQEFYKRYFFPSNTLLAVWGDFDAAQMKGKLEKLFADWTAQQPAVPAFPKVTGKDGGGTYLATKKDVAQTFFAIGQLGGELRDRNYPALAIMSYILGGGFQSRLFQQVRTRMGNAYDIAADWGASYDHPGLFRISGSTKTMSTVETVQAILREVNRIRTSEVSEDELKIAKDSALNSLVFAFDTRAKTLGRMLAYEYYGYPQDFIQQYQKALTAVTREDVQRVAKEYLDPARFTVVAVGNPDNFVEPLDKLGKPAIPIDLTIPEPKRESPAPKAANVDLGRRLLARAQEATGGADKLAAVKDYQEAMNVQVAPQFGGIDVKENERWMAPTYFRQDSQTPAGKISAYTDGKTGWISTPQGTAPLEGAQLEQVQGDLFRLYFRLLLSDRIEGRSVAAVDNSTVEIAGPDGETVRVAFDQATGLPGKVTYKVPRASGPPLEVEDAYTEFHEVNGIKLPLKLAIAQGGRKFADVTVTETKIDTGLQLPDLQKRP